MEVTNKCEPEFWTRRDDPPGSVWRNIETVAERGSYTAPGYNAAALLALRSVLETHRVAGMDIYEQLDELEKRLDGILLRLTALEKTNG